ncbi:hypothetical protein JL720_3263 [Aureococcus anophagefferens]|nr:hypothetical protein JL720_3263 [Aureococcus anophagefferens]
MATETAEEARLRELLMASDSDSDDGEHPLPPRESEGSVEAVEPEPAPPTPPPTYEDLLAGASNTPDAAAEERARVEEARRDAERRDAETRAAGGAEGAAAEAKVVAEMRASGLAFDEGRSYAAPLRVDAAWADVEALVESVLAAHGLVRSSLPALVDPSSSLCEDLPCFLADARGAHPFGLAVGGGATPDKRRVLFVGARDPGRPWTREADGARAAALRAVREAVAEADLAEPTVSTAPKTDVCDVFLADLQRAYFVELEAALKDVADPLDALAHREELKVARLAVLLRPTFDAAGFSPPPPSRAPPLASFPLDLAPGDGLGAFPDGPEAAARRIRNDVGDAGDAAAFLAAALRSVAARAAREARARVDRKNRSVAARLRNAETCADGLVDALQARRAAAARGAEAQFRAYRGPRGARRGAGRGGAGRARGVRRAVEPAGPRRRRRYWRVRRLSASARNSRLLRAVADEPPPPATPLDLLSGVDVPRRAGARAVVEAGARVAAVLPENEEARDKRDLIARLGATPPGDAEPEAPPAYDAAAPQRGNLGSPRRRGL